MNGSAAGAELALVPGADDRLLDPALGKAGEIIAHSAFAVALSMEGMWATLEPPGPACRHGAGDRRQAIGLVSADHRAAVREFLS